MMKKMMLLAAITSALLAGCKKNEETRCTNVDPATEEAAIIAYNTAAGITATKDPSGLYYEILNLGTGVTPNPNSAVTVQYRGKLFNGAQFDSAVNAGGVQFPLTQLIPGWQIGIPKIRVGGTIRLIVPSAYAYGCKGSSSNIPGSVPIPGNSPLFFEIKLLGVN